MASGIISGVADNLLQGTINAGGTLTGQFDTAEYTRLGLIVTGATAGSLNFRVSPFSDANPTNSSIWATVRDATGAIQAITLPAGTTAFSADALRFLSPYKYVRFETTAAQATGAKFYVPVRAS